MSPNPDEPRSPDNAVTTEAGKNKAETVNSCPAGFSPNLRQLPQPRPAPNSYPSELQDSKVSWAGCLCIPRMGLIITLGCRQREGWGWRSIPVGALFLPPPSPWALGTKPPLLPVITQCQAGTSHQFLLTLPAGETEGLECLKVIKENVGPCP